MWCGIRWNCAPLPQSRKMEFWVNSNNIAQSHASMQMHWPRSALSCCVSVYCFVFLHIPFCICRFWMKTSKACFWVISGWESLVSRRRIEWHFHLTTHCITLSMQYSPLKAVAWTLLYMRKWCSYSLSSAPRLLLLLVATAFASSNFFSYLHPMFFFFF